MLFWERFGKEFMGSAKDRILSLFFPPRCPVCDGVVLPGVWLCEPCRKEIKAIREPVCKKCGKPLGDDRAEYCFDCQKRKHLYSQGKAVFVYEGAIRNSIYRFKYAGKREYASFYARAAAELCGGWLKSKNVEAIVPVPMFPRKQRLRGYNQAEVFAKALGRELQIPVDCRLVRRVRNTVPQKELNEQERVQNVKNAFQSAANIVKYRQIVLVDDIYTTGSTMDALAEVLLTAGVKEVYYICISIGKGYRQ